MPTQQVELRATGQVVLFDGFLKIYEEGRDEPEDADDKVLPQIMQGEAAAKKSITPEQHFTQPPPRYTEATLVKKMEEIGIGRPSTYASIVTTIQERGYVRKDKNRLIPEDKGRLVTAFLSNYFRKYVGYEFTANLEEELDDITAGSRQWTEVLARFWRDFKAAVEETAELRITDVLEKINEVLEPHLFPPTADGSDPRLCPNCGQGRLSMRTARSGGAFIGCSNYPECRYTRPFGPPGMDDGDEIGPDGKLLGMDGDDEIRVMKGRFGPYVQRGKVTDEQPKPPRASLPKGWDAAGIDIEKALMLLSLPREVGPHPEDGEMIEAGHRTLWTLRQARQALREPPRGRRGLHHRHEPRGRGTGEESRLSRRSRRGRAPLGGTGRTSRKGRRRPGHERALRTLREMGQGERHAAQGNRSRGGRHGPRREADRRARGQGRRKEEGRAAEEESGGLRPAGLTYTE